MRRPRLLALAAGLAAGLLTLGPLAPLALLPLAALLHLAAAADTPQRLGWGAFGYVGAHLWWVMLLAAQIFGFPPAGLLALALYAVEALFFAALGLLVSRAFCTPRARLWALAGGWVLLEWLRTLGTLAFPWPTLGYIWLETPVIQAADLGGILLISWASVFMAAALADGRRPPRRAALVLLALLTGYGLTRTAADGEAARAFVTRSDVSGFDRLQYGTLLPELQRISAGRQGDEPVIWSETALHPDQNEQALFPAPGLSGAGNFSPPTNTVIAIDAQGRITGENHKGRPVPFGEAFPAQGVLRPVYALLSQASGFNLLESIQPAEKMVPLDLGGIRYGAYVCYDSVFSWSARELSRAGAEVLVNVSNDSWYAGAGVKQHFDMGRVRAIENRRWVLRAVQKGWAGSVDDLGRPREVIREGAQGRSVAYRRLYGVTLYQRLGDLPALGLALLLILWAARIKRGGPQPGNRPPVPPP